MKVDFGNERITLIPENEEDWKQLHAAVPVASRVLCWYTMDAGPTGSEHGFVISHKVIE